MDRLRLSLLRSGALIVLVLLACALLPHWHLLDAPHRSDECLLCHVQAPTIESPATGVPLDAFVGFIPEPSDPVAYSNNASFLRSRAPPA